MSPKEKILSLDTTAMHPDRDGQFKLIHIVRNSSDPERSAVISIDTKKKEPIGLFRNPGKYWGRTPTLVYDHDFRSLADEIAIPYAVYDLRANAGVYYLGISYDTSEFAVNSVATWWADTGQFRYPNARKLCILADRGGSNGCRPCAWKYFLQHNLVNPFRIIVQVTHYPTGTSKWNPVDHRVHSEVSKNWAGVPLVDMETIRNCIRSTTTASGLTITAQLDENVYQKGIRITDEQMAQLNIVYHKKYPKWNYTIQPQTKSRIIVP